MEAIELYYEGVTRLKNKEYEAAILYLIKSDNAEPHFKTREALYRCYIGLNRQEDAFEAIRSAYLLNERSDQTAYEYAEMLSSYKGEHTAAKKMLTEILCRNPSYKRAREFLDNIL